MAIRDHEPIAAIATAPGRGGIGVVRISFGGKDAHAVNALMTALFGQRLITRHAFLNDKLDLAQAEAVADLIEAHTSAAARSAQRSLEGEFSRAVCALIERLTSLRALVEATLDFPEEEIDVLSRADAHGQLTHLRRALEEIRRNARQGALLREGLTI